MKDFQRLQEQELATGEGSSEGNIENDSPNETSSQELIVDDSDWIPQNLVYIRLKQEKKLSRIYLNLILSYICKGKRNLII